MEKWTIQPRKSTDQALGTVSVYTPAEHVVFREEWLTIGHFVEARLEDVGFYRVIISVEGINMDGVLHTETMEFLVNEGLFNPKYLVGVTMVGSTFVHIGVVRGLLPEAPPGRRGPQRS